MDEIVLVDRKFYTKPLFNMTAQERKKETTDIFQLRKNIAKSNYTDKTLLIFDDIYTTGSTVNELILSLKPLSFKSIQVLTLSKAFL